MVTLKEAQQQARVAEQQLQRQEEAARRQQERIQRQRFPARTLKFQREVIARQPREFIGRIEQKKAEFAKQKKISIKEVQKVERELQKYREEQLNPFKEQLSRVSKGRKLQEAIKEYIRVGGERGGNVDPIRKKYGKDVFRKAQVYVESRVKGYVSDFSMPTTVLVGGEMDFKTDIPLSEHKGFVPHSKDTSPKPFFQTIGTGISTGVTSVVSGIKGTVSQLKKDVFGPPKLQEDISKYNKAITKFEKKWQEQIVSNQFTGTEAQFEQYQREFGKLEDKGTKLEAKQQEYEESVIGKTTKEVERLKGTGIGSIFLKEPLGAPEISKRQREFFTAEPGFEKLKRAPGLGIETGKFALFGGLKYTKDIFGRVEARGEKVSPLFGATKEFIPTTPAGVGSYYFGGKLFTRLPKLSAAGFTGLGTYGVVTGETLKEKTIGGITAGIGLFAGGRYGLQKIKTQIPTRKLFDPKFKELKVPVIEKGKQDVWSRYFIFGEKAPPMKVRETRRYREWVGLKPTKEFIRPAKPFGISTIGWVPSKKPFYVIEKTPRGKVGTVSEIFGTSRFRELKTLKGLPKTEQFAWQRLAEYKAGRPVSKEFVPKMFEKEDFKILGFVERRKILRTKPFEEKVSFPWKRGRTTERSLVVSEIKPVKETEFFRKFEVKNVFKDVTYPFARARGRTPVMKGEVVEIKEPIVLDKGKKIPIVKPADVVKTPLSRTFQLTQQQVKLLPKPTIKIKPPRARTTVVGKAKPLVTKPVSAFWGRGLYERTEGGLLPPGTIGIQPVRATLIARTKTETAVMLRPRMETLTLNLQKPILKLQPRTKLFGKTMPILKTKTKQKQRLKQLQKQKLKLKQKQKLKPLAPFVPRKLRTRRAPLKKAGLIPPFPKRRKPEKEKKIRIARISQPFRYTPSFTALALKITGKKPKPLGFDKTYLPGIRPLTYKPLKIKIL